MAWRSGALLPLYLQSVPFALGRAHGGSSPSSSPAPAQSIYDVCLVPASLVSFEGQYLTLSAEGITHHVNGGVCACLAARPATGRAHPQPRPLPSTASLDISEWLEERAMFLRVVRLPIFRTQHTRTTFSCWAGGVRRRRFQRRRIALQQRHPLLQPVLQPLVKEAVRLSADVQDMPLVRLGPRSTYTAASFVRCLQQSSLQAVGPARREIEALVSRAAAALGEAVPPGAPASDKDAGVSGAAGESVAGRATEAALLSDRFLGLLRPTVRLIDCLVAGATYLAGRRALGEVVAAVLGEPVPSPEAGATGCEQSATVAEGGEATRGGQGAEPHASDKDVDEGARERGGDAGSTAPAGAGAEALHNKLRSATSAVGKAKRRLLRKVRGMEWVLLPQEPRPSPNLPRLLGVETEAEGRVEAEEEEEEAEAEAGLRAVASQRLLRYAASECNEDDERALVGLARFPGLVGAVNAAEGTAQPADDAAVPTMQEFRTQYQFPGRVSTPPIFHVRFEVEPGDQAVPASTTGTEAGAAPTSPARRSAIAGAVGVVESVDQDGALGLVADLGLTSGRALAPCVVPNGPAWARALAVALESVVRAVSELPRPLLAPELLPALRTRASAWDRFQSARLVRSVRSELQGDPQVRRWTRELLWGVDTAWKRVQSLLIASAAHAALVDDPTRPSLDALLARYGDEGASRRVGGAKEFEAAASWCLRRRDDLRALVVPVRYGCFVVDRRPLKCALAPLPDALLRRMRTAVPAVAGAFLRRLREDCEEVMERLNADPSTLMECVAWMEALASMQRGSESREDLEVRLEEGDAYHRLLLRRDLSMQLRAANRHAMEAAQETAGRLRALLGKCEARRWALESKFTPSLDRRVEELERRAATLLRRARMPRFTSYATAPADAIRDVAVLWEEMAAQEAEAAECTRILGLFRRGQTHYPNLWQVRRELAAKQLLWQAVRDLTASDKLWRTFAITMLRAGEIGANLDAVTRALERACSQLPALRDAPITDRARHLVRELRAVLPALRPLGDPAMRARHFARVAALLGRPSLDWDAATLNELAALGLPDLAPRIASIAAEARRDAAVEASLVAITDRWRERALPLLPYRGTAVLGDCAGELSDLEDAQTRLDTLAHVHNPWYAETTELAARMGQARAILGRWLELQQLWDSLTGVMAAAELRARWESEAAVIETLDHEWALAMRRFDPEEGVPALPTLGDGQFRERLQRLFALAELGLCAVCDRVRSLRTNCPRLGLLSDAELLRLQAAAGRGAVIAPLLARAFPGVCALSWHEVREVGAGDDRQRGGEDGRRRGTGEREEDGECEPDRAGGSGVGGLHARGRRVYVASLASMLPPETIAAGARELQAGESAAWEAAAAAAARHRQREARRRAREQRTGMSHSAAAPATGGGGGAGGEDDSDAEEGGDLAGNGAGATDAGGRAGRAGPRVAAALASFCRWRVDRNGVSSAPLPLLSSPLQLASSSSAPAYAGGYSGLRFGAIHSEVAGAAARTVSFAAAAAAEGDSAVAAAASGGSVLHVVADALASARRSGVGSDGDRAGVSALVGAVVEAVAAPRNPHPPAAAAVHSAQLLAPAFGPFAGEQESGPQRNSAAPAPIGAASFRAWSVRGFKEEVDSRIAAHVMVDGASFAAGPPLRLGQPLRLRGTADFFSSLLETALHREAATILREAAAAPLDAATLLKSTAGRVPLALAGTVVDLQCTAQLEAAMRSEGAAGTDAEGPGECRFRAVKEAECSLRRARDVLLEAVVGRGTGAAGGSGSHSAGAPPRGRAPPGPGTCSAAAEHLLLAVMQHLALARALRCAAECAPASGKAHLPVAEESFLWATAVRTQWDARQEAPVLVSAGARVPHAMGLPVAPAQRLVLTPATERALYATAAAFRQLSGALLSGSDAIGDGRGGASALLEHLASATGRPLLMLQGAGTLTYEHGRRWVMAAAATGALFCLADVAAVRRHVLAALANAVQAVQSAQAAEERTVEVDGEPCGLCKRGAALFAIHRKAALDPQAGAQGLQFGVDAVWPSPPPPLATAAGVSGPVWSDSAAGAIPASLRHLFRPVALCTPDDTAVLTVELVAAGVEAADVAARIVQAMDLASGLGSSLEVVVSPRRATGEGGSRGTAGESANVSPTRGAKGARSVSRAKATLASLQWHGLAWREGEGEPCFDAESGAAEALAVLAPGAGRRRILAEVARRVRALMRPLLAPSVPKGSAGDERANGVPTGLATTTEGSPFDPPLALPRQLREREALLDGTDRRGDTWCTYEDSARRPAAFGASTYPLLRAVDEQAGAGDRSATPGQRAGRGEYGWLLDAVSSADGLAADGDVAAWTDGVVAARSAELTRMLPPLYSTERTAALGLAEGGGGAEGADGCGTGHATPHWGVRVRRGQHVGAGTPPVLPPRENGALLSRLRRWLALQPNRGQGASEFVSTRVAAFRHSGPIISASEGHGGASRTAELSGSVRDWRRRPKRVRPTPPRFVSAAVSDHAVERALVLRAVKEVVTPRLAGAARRAWGAALVLAFDGEDAAVAATSDALMADSAAGGGAQTEPGEDAREGVLCGPLQGVQRPRGPLSAAPAQALRRAPPMGSLELLCAAGEHPSARAARAALSLGWSEGWRAEAALTSYGDSRFTAGAKERAGGEATYGAAQRASLLHRAFETPKLVAAPRAETGLDAVREGLRAALSAACRAAAVEPCAAQLARAEALCTSAVGSRWAGGDDAVGESASMNRGAPQLLAVTGPPGSGKSVVAALARRALSILHAWWLECSAARGAGGASAHVPAAAAALAAAWPHRPPVPLVDSTLTPAAGHTAADVVGGFDPRRQSRWLDGALPTLCERLSSLFDNGDAAAGWRMQHWALVDGEPGADTLSLLAKMGPGRGYPLPDGRMCRLPAPCRAVVECTALAHADPAVLGAMAVVHVPDAALDWRTVVRSWIDRISATWSRPTATRLKWLCQALPPIVALALRLMGEASPDGGGGLATPNPASPGASVLSGAAQVARAARGAVAAMVRVFDAQLRACLAHELEEAAEATYLELLGARWREQQRAAAAREHKAFGDAKGASPGDDAASTGSHGAGVSSRGSEAGLSASAGDGGAGGDFSEARKQAPLHRGSGTSEGGGEDEGGGARGGVEGEEASDERDEEEEAMIAAASADRAVAKHLDAVFVTAVVWGVGGDVAEPQRGLFSAFVQEALLSVLPDQLLPSWPGMTLYDVGYRPDVGEWQEWEHITRPLQRHALRASDAMLDAAAISPHQAAVVPLSEARSCLGGRFSASDLGMAPDWAAEPPLGSLWMPTQDALRTAFQTRLLLTGGHPVALCGAWGLGKAALAKWVGHLMQQDAWRGANIADLEHASLRPLLDARGLPGRERGGSGGGGGEEGEDEGEEMGAESAAAGCGLVLRESNRRLLLTRFHVSTRLECDLHRHLAPLLERRGRAWLPRNWRAWSGREPATMATGSWPARTGQRATGQSSDEVNASATCQGLATASSSMMHASGLLVLVEDLAAPMPIAAAGGAPSPLDAAVHQLRLAVDRTSVYSPGSAEMAPTLGLRFLVTRARRPASEPLPASHARLSRHLHALHCAWDAGPAMRAVFTRVIRWATGAGDDGSGDNLEAAKRRRELTAVAEQLADATVRLCASVGGAGLVPSAPTARLKWHSVQRLLQGMVSAGVAQLRQWSAQQLVDVWYGELRAQVREALPESAQQTRFDAAVEQVLAQAQVSLEAREAVVAPLPLLQVDSESPVGHAAQTHSQLLQPPAASEMRGRWLLPRPLPGIVELRETHLSSLSAAWQHGAPPPFPLARSSADSAGKRAALSRSVSGLGVRWNQNALGFDDDDDEEDEDEEENENEGEGEREGGADRQRPSDNLVAHASIRADAAAHGRRYRLERGSGGLMQPVLSIERESVGDAVGGLAQLRQPPLVLHEDAALAACRLSAFLRRPNASVVLEGPEGTGRRTLARFAAWLAGLQLVTLSAEATSEQGQPSAGSRRSAAGSGDGDNEGGSGGAGEGLESMASVAPPRTAADLRAGGVRGELKAAVRTAGQRGRPVVLMVNVDVLPDWCVADVAALLLSGSGLPLFTSEDRHAMLARVRRRRGLSHASTEAAESVFRARVRANLRVLWVLPQDAGTRQRFGEAVPQVMDRSYEVHLRHWAPHALHEVASTLLAAPVRAACRSVQLATALDAVRYRVRDPACPEPGADGEAAGPGEGEGANTAFQPRTRVEAKLHPSETHVQAALFVACEAYTSIEDWSRRARRSAAAIALPRVPEPGQSTSDALHSAAGFDAAHDKGANGLCVNPGLFVRALRLAARLFASGHASLHSLRRRLLRAAARLRETSGEVARLQEAAEDVASRAKEAAESRERAEGAWQEAQGCADAAAQRRDQSQQTHRDAMAEQEALEQRLQAAAKGEEEEALARATRSVHALRQSDWLQFGEAASLPPVLRQAADAACLALGKEVGADERRMLLIRRSLGEDVLQVGPADMSAETAGEVQARLTAAASQGGGTVLEQVTSMAGGLGIVLRYLLAVARVAQSRAQTASERERLERLRAEAGRLAEHAAEARKEAEAAAAEGAAAEERVEQAAAEEAEARKKEADATARASRAQDVVALLSREGGQWAHRCAAAEAALPTVLALSVVRAAHMTYLAPLSAEARDAFLRLWLQSCAAKGLPLPSSYALYPDPAPTPPMLVPAGGRATPASFAHLPREGTAAPAGAEKGEGAGHGAPVGPAGAALARRRRRPVSSGGGSDGGGEGGGGGSEASLAAVASAAMKKTRGSSRARRRSTVSSAVGASLAFEADECEDELAIVPARQVQEWTQVLSLPADSHAVESAVMALSTSTCPLFIDPHGVAQRWLVALYRSSRFRPTLKGASRGWSRLRRAIAAGARHRASLRHRGRDTAASKVGPASQSLLARLRAMGSGAGREEEDQAAAATAAAEPKGRVEEREGPDADDGGAGGSAAGRVEAAEDGEAEELQNLDVVRLPNPNWTRTLWRAVQLGRALLLVNVPFPLPRALEPVLRPQFLVDSRTGHRYLVSGPSYAVPFHPAFRLFLSTSEPDVAVDAEMASRVTVVSFVATRAGAEHRLLRAAASQCLSAEAETMRVLHQGIVRDRDRAWRLEEATLALLAKARSPEAVVGEDSALSAIKHHKTRWRMARQSQRDAMAKAGRMTRQCDGLRPVARHAAAWLLLATHVLGCVDTAYDWQASEALTWLMEGIGSGVKSARSARISPPAREDEEEQGEGSASSGLGTSLLSGGSLARAAAAALGARARPRRAGGAQRWSLRREGPGATGLCVPHSAMDPYSAHILKHVHAAVYEPLARGVVAAHRPLLLPLHAACVAVLDGALAPMTWLCLVHGARAVVRFERGRDEELHRQALLRLALQLGAHHRVPAAASRAMRRARDAQSRQAAAAGGGAGDGGTVTPGTFAAAEADVAAAVNRHLQELVIRATSEDVRSHLAHLSGGGGLSVPTQAGKAGFGLVARCRGAERLQRRSSMTVGTGWSSRDLLGLVDHSAEPEAAGQEQGGGEAPSHSESLHSMATFKEVEEEEEEDDDDEEKGAREGETEGGSVENESWDGGAGEAGASGRKAAAGRKGSLPVQPPQPQRRASAVQWVSHLARSASQRWGSQVSLLPGGGVPESGRRGLEDMGGLVDVDVEADLDAGSFRSGDGRSDGGSSAGTSAASSPRDGEPEEGAAPGESLVMLESLADLPNDDVTHRVLVAIRMQVSALLVRQAGHMATALETSGVADGLATAGREEQGQALPRHPRPRASVGRMGPRRGSMMRRRSSIQMNLHSTMSQLSMSQVSASSEAGSDSGGSDDEGLRNPVLRSPMLPSLRPLSPGDRGSTRRSAHGIAAGETGVPMSPIRSPHGPPLGGDRSRADDGPLDAAPWRWRASSMRTGLADARALLRSSPLGQRPWASPRLVAELAALEVLGNPFTGLLSHVAMHSAAWERFGAVARTVLRARTSRAGAGARVLSPEEAQASDDVGGPAPTPKSRGGDGGIEAGSEDDESGATSGSSEDDVGAGAGARTVMRLDRQLHRVSSYIEVPEEEGEEGEEEGEEAKHAGAGNEGVEGEDRLGSTLASLQRRLASQPLSTLLPPPWDIRLDEAAAAAVTRCFFPRAPPSALLAELTQGVEGHALALSERVWRLVGADAVSQLVWAAQQAGPYTPIVLRGAPEFATADARREGAEGAPTTEGELEGSIPAPAAVASGRSASADPVSSLQQAAAEWGRGIEVVTMSAGACDPEALSRVVISSRARGCWLLLLGVDAAAAWASNLELVLQGRYVAWPRVSAALSGAKLQTAPAGGAAESQLSTIIERAMAGSPGTSTAAEAHPEFRLWLSHAEGRYARAHGAELSAASAMGSGLHPRSAAATSADAVAAPTDASPMGSLPASCSARELEQLFQLAGLVSAPTKTGGKGAAHRSAGPDVAGAVPEEEGEEAGEEGGQGAAGEAAHAGASAAGERAALALGTALGALEQGGWSESSGAGPSREAADAGLNVFIGRGTVLEVHPHYTLWERPLRAAVARQPVPLPRTLTLAAVRTVLEPARGLFAKQRALWHRAFPPDVATTVGKLG